MKIPLEEIERQEWIKAWSGKWSILTCTYLGEQHSHTVKHKLGKCLPHLILIVKHGIST